MKRLLLAALLLVAASAQATEADFTVKVTRFHQSYPYSGKATIEYTVSGILPANADAEIVISTDDTSATFVQSNILASAFGLPVTIPVFDPSAVFGGGGATVIASTSVVVTQEIDFASSFGGALLLTNASFVVTISEGVAPPLGGVQLWANGPYWAECNVGATRPEEYGSYVAWDEEAATANLGSPWRTPTSAELSALAGNCNSSWIITNGVAGRLFIGTGDYADRCIFLPAAGYYGAAGELLFSGEAGAYWSSTENSMHIGGVSPDEGFGFYLFFDSNGSRLDDSYYHYRRPVRPVRDPAQ